MNSIQTTDLNIDNIIFSGLISTVAMKVNVLAVAASRFQSSPDDNLNCLVFKGKCHNIFFKGFKSPGLHSLILKVCSSHIQCFLKEFSINPINASCNPCFKNHCIPINGSHFTNKPVEWPLLESHWFDWSWADADLVLTVIAIGHLDLACTNVMTNNSVEQKKVCNGKENLSRILK